MYTYRIVIKYEYFIPNTDSLHITVASISIMCIILIYIYLSKYKLSNLNKHCIITQYKPKKYLSSMTFPCFAKNLYRNTNSYKHYICTFFIMQSNTKPFLLEKESKTIKKKIKNKKKDRNFWPFQQSIVYKFIYFNIKLFSNISFYIFICIFPFFIYFTFLKS